MNFQPAKNGLVYQPTKWDAYSWDEFQLAYPQTEVVAQQGCDRINRQFPALLLEFFQRLHGTPQELDPMRPECQWAKALHDQLTELPNWQAMVSAANGDRVLAGLGTLTFSQRLLADLPEEMPEAPDLEQAEELRHQYHQAGQDPSTSPDEKAQQQAEIRAQGKAAVEAAAGYAEAISEALEGKLGQQVAVAIADAAEELEQVKAAIAAFSIGKTPGSLQSGGSMAAKVAIAQRLAANPKLRKVVALAGRMELRAKKQRRSRSRHANTELVGVTQGRDLTRLLPTEVARLATPESQVQFAQGYMEGSLQQYQLGGKERQGKGPLVIALDSSGSMSGSKEVWAKAVALTMTKQALSQKRPVRILHFDSQVQRVDDFKPGKRQGDSSLLESMDAFFNGGTSWQAALDCAGEAVGEPKGAFKRADVVLVTDGEDWLEDGWVADWQALVKARGITTYGVMLGTPLNRRRASPTFSGQPQVTSELDKVCDRILHIPDLADDGDADQLFEI